MPSLPIRIFISSVQKELQAERYAIRHFVERDPLLKQFFTGFLFEDLPPTDQRPDSLYLDQVARSSVYVGLFGNQYGWKDENGLSPTEREFLHASELNKRRLIFIKGTDDSRRDPDMRALISRAGGELVRKRFESTEQLIDLLHQSLIRYLQDSGFITADEYDAAPCEGAALNDISTETLYWFIERARAERGYKLTADTSVEDALAHMHLLAGGLPSRGALLLFGREPSRFIRSAEINCLHYHGTQVAKPIPSQQVYRGTVFEMIDRAVDFVMEKLARSVVPSGDSPASEIRYEIPYPVIREAVVNSVAHRNYASRSAVQVMVFADRVEVWNPGGLPEDLTAAQLRKPHHSVPRNRLVCEPLFLAHYIERAGTGTLDMIRLCAEVGLPEPEFRDEGEHFITTIRRPFQRDETKDTLQPPHQVTHQVTHQVAFLLHTLLEGEMKRGELMERLQLRDRVSFRTNYLRPALEANLVEMSQPKSPTSPTQTYRLTKFGRRVLKDTQDTDPSQ